MISREDIEKIAKDIGEASKAERVILFGSHAKGSATIDSDVDLMVVAESDLPRFKRSRALYKSIRPHRVAMDIVVITPGEMLRARQSRVSFVSQVLREGETVYVRG
jgi:predicted nucleotidyltransferase